jgi:hypothetical protein
MGKIPRKKESTYVQGICVLCETNKQAHRGGGRYRAICNTCHFKRHEIISNDKLFKQSIKSDTCNECGFVAKHHIQMDIDHIDGNPKNNSPENLQTLCSNCHRYKTFLNEDWTPNNS